MKTKEIIPIEIEFGIDTEYKPGILIGSVVANFNPYPEKDFGNLCKDFYKLMHKYRINELFINLPKASYNGVFYEALQEGFSKQMEDYFTTTDYDLRSGNIEIIVNTDE